jgi:hypothetical protein
MQALFASQFKHHMNHAFVMKVLNIPHYILVRGQMLQNTYLVACRLEDAFLCSAADLHHFIGQRRTFNLVCEFQSVNGG